MEGRAPRADGFIRLTSDEDISGGGSAAGRAERSDDDDRFRRIRRDHIGFVFQFFNLIPSLTVRENVLLTAELSGWSAGDAQAQVKRLVDAASTHPVGRMALGRPVA